MAIQMLITSIGCAVIGLSMLYSHRSALFQATSYVSYMASKYGHDTLYNDFCAARYCGLSDNFRLGRHFLYSRYANTIISYSEISSVQVVRESNFDGPPDDLIVCVRNGFSSIAIGHFLNQDSALHVSEIKARIEAAHNACNPHDTSPESTDSSQAPGAVTTSRLALQYNQEELEILRTLRQDGAISDEEYQQLLEKQADT